MAACSTPGDVERLRKLPLDRFHRLVAHLGRDRMERLAASFRHNASGWATNVALGFLLGFAPAAGRFFGRRFLRGIAGIGVMFVLNLTVAFSLSLFNAAQAYSMPLSELGGVLRHAGRRLLSSPLDFIRPPRPEAAPQPHA